MIGQVERLQRIYTISAAYSSRDALRLRTNDLAPPLLLEAIARSCPVPKREAA